MIYTSDKCQTQALNSTIFNPPPPPTSQDSGINTLKSPLTLPQKIIGVIVVFNLSRLSVWQEISWNKTPPFFSLFRVREQHTQAHQQGHSTVRHGKHLHSGNEEKLISFHNEWVINKIYYNNLQH